LQDDRVRAATRRAAAHRCIGVGGGDRIGQGAATGDGDLAERRLDGPDVASTAAWPAPLIDAPDGRGGTDGVVTGVEDGAALKLAFSDRHAFYGDPRQVRVPMDGLLSKAYADTRRALIDPHRAWPEMPPTGDPWHFDADRPERLLAALGGVAKDGPAKPDTSYLCVVDEEGNAFSATPSDGLTGTPIVPGLGIIISARGSQSWLDPDHPSAVAPGRRPRLTPSPGMVLKDGELFMPYGTPGGDVHPQAMLQFLLNMTSG
jgi:gamma-glutamyltranspeptidase